MCPIQSLVSLLRLLADVVIPEPLRVHTVGKEGPTLLILPHSQQTQ